MGNSAALLASVSGPPSDSGSSSGSSSGTSAGPGSSSSSGSSGTLSSGSTIGAITNLPYAAFAANSPWNQPLPANPAIDSRSAAMLSNLFQNFNGRFFLNPPGTPGDFPHYFTVATDPTVTIVDQPGSCAPGLSPGSIEPMPADAAPATSSADQHLTVLNASTGDEWDYYQFPLNEVITAGETINLTCASQTNYFTGSGFGGNTTAAGAALLGGLITVDEYQSGTIHHALAMAPGCNNCAPGVYPATAYACSQCPVTPTAPGIAEGSRIWSDLTDSQVDALGMDVVSTMLLKALYHYGGFMTDTNGWVALDIRNLMEAPVTAQGSAWWSQNGGNSPALNSQPPSFYTTHFHVLQACVTQGGC